MKSLGFLSIVCLAVVAFCSVSEAARVRGRVYRPAPRVSLQPRHVGRVPSPLPIRSFWRGLPGSPCSNGRCSR